MTMQRARPIHRIYLLLSMLTVLLAGCAPPFATPIARSTSTTTSFPPVATLTPTPSAVPPLTPQAAWGAYHVTQIALPSGNTSFYAEDVAPDGSVIVGLYRAANQAQYIAVITVATRHLRLLYTMPKDMQPLCVQTDGRYVGWAGGSDGEGAQNGHDIVGYADLATGKIHQLADVTDYSIPGNCRVEHGKLIWMHPNVQLQQDHILLTDMARDATTELHLPQSPNFYEWPYALYETYSQTTRLMVIHLYNLTTNVDTPVTALNLTGDFSGNQYPLALAGTTLFRLLGNVPTGLGSASSEQLQEIDHADQSGASMHTVTQGDFAPSLQGFGANDRVVLIAREAADGSGTIPLIWDRVQQRLVTFTNQAGYLKIVRGVFLVMMPTDNTIDLIDTSQLPAA